MSFHKCPATEVVKKGLEAQEQSESSAQWPPPHPKALGNEGKSLGKHPRKKTLKKLSNDCGNRRVRRRLEKGGVSAKKAREKVFHGGETITICGKKKWACCDDRQSWLGG